MKKTLNKLILAGLLLPQTIILAKNQDTQTWREKTTQNLSLMGEYLEARYEIAKDDLNKKLEKLNKKFKETKEWVKKNPKKTAAAVAVTLIITAIAIRKLTQNKYNAQKYSTPIEPSSNKASTAPDSQNVAPSLSEKQKPSTPSPAPVVTTAEPNQQNVPEIGHNSDYDDFLNHNPKQKNVASDEPNNSYGLSTSLIQDIAKNPNDHFNNLANGINPKNAIVDPTNSMNDFAFASYYESLSSGYDNKMNHLTRYLLIMDKYVNDDENRSKTLAELIKEAGGDQNFTLPK